MNMKNCLRKTNVNEASPELQRTSFLTSSDLVLILAECDGLYLPSDCREQSYYRTGILGGIASLHNIRVIFYDSTTLCSKLAKLDLHNLYIQLSPS